MLRPSSKPRQCDLIRFWLGGSPFCCCHLTLTFEQSGIRPAVCTTFTKVRCFVISDLPSVQRRGEGQASEARGSVEPTPPIKEEPKRQNIQTGDPGEAEDLEQASPPHLMASLSPPPLAPREVKTEAGRDEGGARPPADSLPSSTTAWSNTAKKQQRTEQQSRKQSAHLLQIKNVKSLRPVSPRPSPPSPGIQRWHSCRECGKGFSFACQLEVHMRWHTKEKPYSCSVCRKSFTTVSMLKRHHRIHTGEKPFHCHVCGKCFNQSAHLNTHFRLHTRERASWSRSTASAKT